MVGSSDPRLRLYEFESLLARGLVCLLKPSVSQIIQLGIRIIYWSVKQPRTYKALGTMPGIVLVLSTMGIQEHLLLSECVCE